MYSSEWLRVLDENTVKYMINELKAELAEKEASLAKKNAELSKKDSELSRKDALIASLLSENEQLRNMQSKD